MNLKNFLVLTLFSMFIIFLFRNFCYGDNFAQNKGLANSAITNNSTQVKLPSKSPSTKPLKLTFPSLKNVSKLSSIEKDFAQRTKAYGIILRQFGYNFFSPGRNLALAGTVGSNYVLGPGDELYVYVIGEIPGVDMSNFPQKLVVDREGKIYIPGFGVFYVSGLTLKEAQELLSKTLKINIKLTVAKVRTFPVYVSGEVRNPGPVMVTSLHTLIDALIMAGGIKKTGSLREVVVTRKEGGKVKKIKVDFYQLLLKGKPVDFTLKDGDVIFVPTIEKVVGIGGAVKRPAIYELKGNETIQDLIKMAGGVLPSAYKYKVILERYVENQKLKVLEGMLDNSTFLNKSVKDGDLIIIKKIVPLPKNIIKVKGYTPYPGIYEYKPGLKLSEFLTKDFFYVDTNNRFALIIRHYPPGAPPKYIAFSPKDVLNGKEDLKLKPMDEIVFYRFGQIANFDFNKVKNLVIVKGVIKYPGLYAWKEGMSLSSILDKDQILINTNLRYGEIERRDPVTLKVIKTISFVPINILEGKEDVPLKPLDTVKFFPKYVNPPIKVTGCVKKALYIPYETGLTLRDALSHVEFCTDVKRLKALIFSNISKSTKTVFLYNLLIENDPKANVKLSPGDRVWIKRVSPEDLVEKVTLLGYVKKPGVYPINEKMTLYDVLKMAGGFKPQAYPPGIIILRKSVAKMQQQLVSKAEMILRRQLQVQEAAISKSELTPEEAQVRFKGIEAQKQLLTMIQKSSITGRISGLKIPKKLDLLKKSPFNIILENGDEIIVPKKPAEILVFGEVYNPCALVYRPGLTVEDYIKQAGGFTRNADVSDIFVIKPDGSAYSLTSFKKWIYWDPEKKTFLLRGGMLGYVPSPGDAIVVPVKVEAPIMWRPLIKDVIQILYQSALTVYTISHL